jgi:type II secretion system protein G
MKGAIILGALVIAAAIVWTQVDFCKPVRAYIRSEAMERTDNSVAQALYTFMPDNVIDAFAARAGFALTPARCIAWDLGFVHPAKPLAVPKEIAAPRSRGPASREVTAQFATADGNPLVHAEVRVFAPGEPATPFTTGVSDAAGKFVFDADRDGVWSIEAKTSTEIARITKSVTLRVGTEPSSAASNIHECSKLAARQKLRASTPEDRPTLERCEVAHESIKRLASVLDIYKLDVGSYPTTEQGLQALLTRPSGLVDWSGPYLKGLSVPLDPWWHPFVYRMPSARLGHDYDLYSLGPNGRLVDVDQSDNTLTN